jgi:uncharacterized protein
MQNETKNLPNANYEDKKSALLERMSEYTKSDVILAFSGGADSSLLLKLLCQAAEKNQTKVYAVTIHTTLHPVYEVAIAKQVAQEAGAIHLVVEVDEMAEAGIEDNPEDRCYRCKKYLFRRLKKMAKELSIDMMLEGTNEDDLHVYRPGIRAVRELGVISPLVEVHMTKAEVRSMASEYGISVAMRPSTPCLATRFPYGTRLSYENMQKVEQAEDYLRKMDFYNVRLRVHGEIARIEIDASDMERLLVKKDEIITYLKQLGYSYVTLDLEGFRSGSMDIHVQAEA